MNGGNVGKNLISEFSEKLVITHSVDCDKSQKELTSGEDDTRSPPHPSSSSFSFAVSSPNEI